MADEFPGTAAWLRGQWSNPSDIFTILLIIGGDIVRVAVAQLCAGPVPYLTPVSFSFGWVSYAVSAMLSAVGEIRLMPPPETECLVVNAKSGYSRSNHSWVLSRMLRDFDYWYPKAVGPSERDKVKQLREESIDPEDVRVGLRVSIWRCSQPSGKGYGDRVYWSGFLVAAVQLAIAAVPWGLYGEWFTFLVTIAGTALAFASGALPQWTQEKVGVRYQNRSKKVSSAEGGKTTQDTKNVFLTQGNGAHDAILILGCDLDLEALAAPYRHLKSPWTTRVLSMALATLWVALLISVAGWQQHTWYLLGVGIIGLLHNILVAGMKRQPRAFGIYLDYKQTIVEEKVMQTLWNVEKLHPRAGKALVEIFFPGKLQAREELLWAFAERRYQATKNLKIDLEDDEWNNMPPLRSSNGSDYKDDIPQEGPYKRPSEKTSASKVTTSNAANRSPSKASSHQTSLPVRDSQASYEVMTEPSDSSEKQASSGADAE